MSTDILDTHRLIWQEKAVLRQIYQDYYQRITEVACEGRSLEIGGGSGNLKQYLKDVISTDIIQTPWLDASCDAQALPFAKQTFNNIIAVDVLHHIERPIRFFQEANRILKPGGRIILIEPAITGFSWFFYHFLHQEPVVLKADPLENSPQNPHRNPFDANQAIPELLFGKYLAAFKKSFPSLSLISKHYFNFCCYPLSGGFKKWCFIPQKAVSGFLRFEKIFEKSLGKYLGFRMLVVIQKDGGHHD